MMMKNIILTGSAAIWRGQIDRYGSINIHHAPSVDRWLRVAARSVGQENTTVKDFQKRKKNT
jgi:hypothetical protein